MRWARVVATLLLLVVALAQPVNSAEGDPPGHGTGTDVRFEGTEIIITVNLVVLIRSNLLDTSVQQFMQDQLQAAADYWNEGLAGHPYFECFTVKIEVVATFVHPVNRDFSAPGHVIRTYGSSDVGTMADGRQLPDMLDPAGLADPTTDYEGPFDHRVDGFWPPWLFQDTAGLAHELGHMFGLGDDYARDENGNTAPLDGRDGTLMDSGDAIDSTLAQRVGDQVLGAGYGDRIPTCWKGTAKVASSVDYPGGSAHCEDGWDVGFAFVVDAEGKVKGTSNVDLASGPTCSFPIGPSIEHLDYQVVGERTADGFSVEFQLAEIPSGNGGLYGGLGVVWSAAPGCGGPLVLTVAGTSASGRGSWQCESGNPPATYTASGPFEATCVSTCPENP